MSKENVLLFWKLTALEKPEDGQSCLVYNSCDGFRIADWDESDDCFYEQPCDEPISSQLAVFWMGLPIAPTEYEVQQCAEFQVVSVASADEREEFATSRPLCQDGISVQGLPPLD